MLSLLKGVFPSIEVGRSQGYVSEGTEDYQDGST